MTKKSDEKKRNQHNTEKRNVGYGDKKLKGPNEPKT